MSQNNCSEAFSNFMTVVCLIFLVGVCFLLQYDILPPSFTSETLKEATSEAINNDFKDGFVFEAMTDGWGNKIHLSRTINADKTITYTAISAGKDGVLGTKDDLSKAVKSSLSKKN